MSYIIYYAFFLRDFFMWQLFRVFPACTACLCSYVILFITMLLNDARREQKEIAKCLWQRKLNKQSQKFCFFQFQRSLMSFVSRNLCREMQSHVKGVYVVFPFGFPAHASRTQIWRTMLIHYISAVSSSPFIEVCTQINSFSIFPSRRAKELTRKRIRLHWLWCSFLSVTFALCLPFFSSSTPETPSLLAK